MFRILASLVSTRAGSTRRTPSLAQRRVRPGLEVLEGRCLPSVAPIHVVAAPPQALQYLSNASPVVDVPSLQGYSFHLTSSNGKPAHDLYIKTESYLPDGSANFTGTWTGEKGGGVNAITDGSLHYDAQGNIAISFSWKNGQNRLDGTITQISNRYSRVSGASVFGSTYHLEGDVTTGNPGGGPGHVSGDGHRLLLFKGV
jgi:hypothetical protein